MTTLLVERLDYLLFVLLSLGALGSIHIWLRRSRQTSPSLTVWLSLFALICAAGISADFPINRYMRDAKVLQIIEGTNQIQRNIIGNSLLGAAAKR